MKKGLSIAVAALLGTVLAYLVNGFAVQRLWMWFVVTTFDVPSLPLKAAIGVSILMALTARTPYAKREESKADGWGEVLAVGLAKDMTPPLFALLVGYIVHLL